MSTYLFLSSLLYTFLFVYSTDWKELNFFYSLADLGALAMKLAITILMIYGWLMFAVNVGWISLHFGG